MAEGESESAINIRLMGFLLQQMAENERGNKARAKMASQEAAQGPSATRAPATSEARPEAADGAQTGVSAAGSHAPGRAEAPPPAEEAQGSAGGAHAAPAGSMAARALGTIAEEPESEESVDPSPRAPPKRKSKGGEDGRRKEAPPASDRNAAIQGCPVPKRAAASPRNALRKAVPAHRKERPQGKLAKNERTTSSEDLSDEIWEQEERTKKLRRKREARRAAKLKEQRKAREHAASKKQAGGRRTKEESSSSSTSYSDSYYDSESPEVARKRCRRSSKGPSRSRSMGPRGGAQSPDLNQNRRGSRSRSGSGRKEQPGHSEAWSGTANRHKEEDKGGSGKGAPQPSKAENFHEAYANKGFYRTAGGSSSFQETRSGSRTEAGREPPARAVEWLEEQARIRNLHKFTQYWHYPKGWPPSYYVDGELYCPPKVEGQAREHFEGAKGLIFNFLDRSYKYVGQHGTVPFKQHWEPFPFPQKGHKTKGKGKPFNKQPRRDEGRLEEEERGRAEGDSAARNWFT